MPEEGIEHAQSVESTENQVVSGEVDPPRVDVSVRELVPFGPADLSVENALAMAIERASKAERWDVVAQLARELEARRLAATGAIDLDVERERRKK